MRALLARDERPVAAVPRAVTAAFALALTLKVLAGLAAPPAQPRAQDLPLPPAADALRVAVLGEPAAAARALMLWLQAFDNQPGVSIPFRDLDYDRVIGWLGRILDLDPRSQYPLLAAARIYTEVPDPVRQRRMLAFVRERFDEDPAARWPWLAHAVYVAKHRLGDLPLALEYARAIAARTTPAQAPAWARQMHLFVLEDMGEAEAAKVLIGGLLASGTITDPNELNFLKWRLAQMGGP